MKGNTSKESLFGIRENKAKQTQFRYLASSTNQRQDFVSTIQILFHGFGCRKGYTALYVKSEFYEFLGGKP